MRPQPLVSVVIPVFNGAQFVAQAVESVRAQTYGPVQLIVVDDGSTDGSQDVVARLSVDRFVELDENRGVSVARNVGTALSQGAFVTYLDADDQMAPDKLERQMQRITSEPRCDCVLTQQQILLEADITPPQWFEVEFLSPGRLIKLPISALIRTSSLIVSGGFNPSFRTSEEMDVLMRLARSGAILDELAFPGVIRRLHGANASYAHEQMSKDLLRAMAPLARRRPPPLVSVIVPVHQPVCYLQTALDSILGQEGISHGDIEIIVVDDGSSDPHGLASRATGATTLARQPRLGVGAARNHGVLLSRGQHLAFLDSDDVWGPDKLATQLALLDAQPWLDAVFGVVEEFVSPELPAEQAGQLHARGRAVGRLPGSMLVRRSAFARAGFFPTALDEPEAALWYASAVDAGFSMADTDGVVLRRRLHGNNNSIRADTMRAYPRVLKEILDRRRG